MYNKNILKKEIDIDSFKEKNVFLPNLTIGYNVTLPTLKHASIGFYLIAKYPSARNIQVI